MPDDRIGNVTVTQDLLKFNPKWWWDPVPIWLVDKLDRGVLVELAKTQLELESVVLKGLADANKKATRILERAIG